VWFKSPYPGMIHDCAISEHYIVLALIPQVMDIERLKRGGIAFQWDPGLDHVYIVAPRGGDAKDVRFFRAPNAMPGHTINAFDDGGKLYLTCPSLWAMSSGSSRTRTESFRRRVRSAPRSRAGAST